MPTDELVRRMHATALRPIFSTLDTRGIKRSWLADQLGITRPRLSRYEHGERRPPEWFAERACRILGIPPELILPPHASAGAKVSLPPAQESYPPENSRRSHSRRARGPPERALSSVSLPHLS